MFRKIHKHLVSIDTSERIDNIFFPIRCCVFHPSGFPKNFHQELTVYLEMTGSIEKTVFVIERIFSSSCKYHIFPSFQVIQSFDTFLGIVTCTDACLNVVLFILFRTEHPVIIDTEHQIRDSMGNGFILFLHFIEVFLCQVFIVQILILNHSVEYRINLERILGVFLIMTENIDSLVDILTQKINFLITVQTSCKRHLCAADTSFLQTLQQSVKKFFFCQFREKFLSLQYHV